MIFSSDMRKRFRLCPQWTTIILFAGLHGVFVATATPTNSLRVVTSFYPIYIATLNVTQGAPGVEVVNMTSPFTGCLHDYQIVPRDLVILTKAQVFMALAKMVPGADGKMIANPYKNWNEVDASLPAQKIEVLGPPPTSGTRDSFHELVMERGALEIESLAQMKKDDAKAFDPTKRST